MGKNENGNILIFSADMCFDDKSTNLTTVFKKRKELIFESKELLHSYLMTLMNNLNSEATKAVLIFLPVTIAAEQGSLIFNHIPIGLYYYQKQKDISEILEIINEDLLPKKSEVVVLAMWKEFSLNLGEKIYQAFLKGCIIKDTVVNKWFADDVSRDNLVQKIYDTDISLLVYLGHGRSRGWSGYRGLRWHHLSFRNNFTINVIISMTCDNLKFVNNELPFGVKWVFEKRAYAFLGAVESVKIFPMKRICSLFSEIFSAGKVATIGELIVIVNRKIFENENEQVQECWQKFRLIGNPLARI